MGVRAGGDSAILKTVVGIPALDLDNPHAIEQVQQMKDRLEILTWYLLARAINTFFNRFPDIKRLSIENLSQGPIPKLCFVEDPGIEGYRYTVSDESRRALIQATGLLDKKFRGRLNEHLAPLLMGLERQGYINAGEVYEVFGRIWTNAGGNPMAQWTVLLAEVAQAELEGSVDPGMSAEGHTPNRM